MPAFASRRILGPWPLEHRALARPATTPRPSRSSPRTARRTARRTAGGRAARERPRAAIPTAGTARSTTSCSPPSRRPPACSRPTGRWSISSTRRPGTSASRTTPASESQRSRTCVRTIRLPVGTGMFGHAVAERAVVHDRRLPRRPRLRPRARYGPGRRGHRASARWSWPRSSRATRSSGRSAPSARGPRPSARRRSPSSGRWPTTPPRRWPTPGSSRRSTTRAPSWPSAPRSSARCARSPPGSARPPTCRRSSSAPSTRRRASSRPMAPASTWSTRDSTLLRRAYASGAVRPDAEEWPDDPDETLDQGVSGQAVVTGQAAWTGDYVNDDAFQHGRLGDDYVGRVGIHSVMAAPLIGEAGPFGALTIFTRRPDAWARGGRGAARGHRRPGGHHDHDDATDRGAATGRARRSAGGPRRSRRCARSPPGSPSCASRRRSSRTSSSRPGAWSGRTA